MFLKWLLIIIEDHLIFIITLRNKCYSIYYKLKITKYAKKIWSIRNCFDQDRTKIN